MKKTMILLCSILITVALHGQYSDSLMLYCTFDDVNAIENPAFGLSGTFNANPTTNFITGVEGNAYHANYYESDLVTFPKEVIPPDRGCVEFWGRLFDMPEYVNENWNHCPAFFRTSNEEETAVYFIEFNGNNGAEGAGLCGRAGVASNNMHGNAASGSWLDMISFESILGDVNAWHHYALSWDIDGVPGSLYTMQLYLDYVPVGSCIAPDSGDDWCLVGASVPTWGEFCIATFTMDQGGLAIDELKVWNYPKTIFVEEAVIFTPLEDIVACKNENAIFEVEADGIPPIYYQWQKDGEDIPGAVDGVLNIQQVQPDDAGEYRCIASNNYGSDTSNSALLIVEFAEPTTIIGPTTINPYQVVLYSAELHEGHTYDFTVEGGNIIDGTVNSITVHWGEAGEGSILLLETSGIGCIADSNFLYVTIGAAGVEDHEFQAMTLYPNPVNDKTTIYFNLNEHDDVSLFIYNSVGYKVNVPVNTFQKEGKSQITLDAEGLPAGIYFCVLKTNEGIYTMKMIKL